MLRRGTGTRAGGHTQYHGHRDLAAEHITHLRRLIDQLVHADGQKVAEHQLGDGPQSGRRRADRAADDGAFGDRRVAHSIRAELIYHSGADTEAAAERADVFAEQYDVGVFTHPYAHALADAFSVSHHFHLSRTSSTISE